MVSEPNKIRNITFNEATLLRGDHYRDKRDRAVTDLLKQNNFVFSESEGPYDVNFSLSENRLVMDIKGKNDYNGSVRVPLLSMRSVMKDYHIICESYFEAVKFADPSKVEAIDFGRRATHNEGAELLIELTKNSIVLDFETSRRLFTLIYVMQLK